MTTEDRTMLDGPVFVTGSPRSGTSIFVLALQKATGIAGYSEGHLVDVYGPIEAVVDRHYVYFAGPASDPAHALGHVGPDAIKLAIAVALLNLSDQVHGGRVWLDKTGGTDMLAFLRILTHLDRPFRTFFLYRRAIENVFSRLKKFPDYDIAYHARDWAKTMRAWRQTRETLPPGTWLEVEHKDIADHPVTTAAATARVLGLDGGQIDKMVEVFETERPQVVASEKVGRVLTLSGTGWSDEQQAIFRREVDEEMNLWGFTYDETYRVNE